MTPERENTPNAVMGATLLLAGPDILFQAWVLWLLWGWFVLPFIGMDLAFVQAVGLTTFRLVVLIDYEPLAAQPLDSGRAVVKHLLRDWTMKLVLLMVSFVVHMVIA